MKPTWVNKRQDNGVWWYVDTNNRILVEAGYGEEEYVLCAYDPATVEALISAYTRGKARGFYEGKIAGKREARNEIKSVLGLPLA